MIKYLSWPSNADAMQADPLAPMTVNMIMPGAGQQQKQCGPVIVMDRDIYLHCPIDDRACLDLLTALKHVNKDLLHKAIDLGVDPKTLAINLHIASPGGSLYSGFAMMDAVAKNIIPVDTYIEGYAASAATIISVAGRRRYMTENSQMLIHQLSSFMMGKYEELKDDMKNSDQAMEMIRACYRKYTRIPVEMINEILTHDLWWTKEECLKYGLVDEVV